PACRIPDNDRRSYSRSCARFQTPCKVPPSPRRLAGEPQTAVFHPLPNTPSKASLPPLYGEKCHLCVRYNVLPMSQAAHLQSALPVSSDSPPNLSRKIALRFTFSPAV